MVSVPARGAIKALCVKTSFEGARWFRLPEAAVTTNRLLAIDGKGTIGALRDLLEQASTCLSSWWRARDVKLCAKLDCLALRS